MMMKLLLLILFCFSFSAYAQESVGSISEIAAKKKVRFIKAKVIIYKKDTLAKILRRFVREDSIINKREAMVEKTLNSNPNIKDWRKLKAGETIYVYLDPKFIDMNKMKKFRKDVKKVSKTIKKKLEKKKDVSSVKKWSTFYMASLGQFSQKNDSLAKIDFKQNSPVTLGIMYTHYPKHGKHTISTSAYFSHLLAASSNLDSGSVAVPLEIGFNAYYQYPFSKASYNLYGGIDFEKFNTFNLASVEAGEDLVFDENQLGFLTFGYSKAFKIKKKIFLFKTSLSQSVFSSRTVAYAADTDSSSYSGQKFMLFLLTKVKKNFFMSTLLKYHVLSGPSDVTALRFGLGAGYLF